ncbi:hypothetical protein RCG23_13405 [Neobacillus sp. PS3-34]|uniref:hypothetical protein n=1 Tax=Neobacillus sp. PS3-34 TaxID=3070678 RepID=UPI0027DEEFC6|nr:hypothetical protein [Neobacillus sp. PS3-34]WML46648.1 hypothetical protein RCG23_13405 [Neobacillus sp. PS3-34]
MIKGLFNWITPEQKFWKWFQENSDQFYQMSEEDKEELFDILHVQLQKIHKELVFEFQVEPDIDGVKELIISADGMRELIPYVLKLVNIAPKLKNWKITAFRQRMEGIEINFNGFRISEDTVLFTYDYTADSNFINVNLFLENYEAEMQGTLFLLLDSCLGEFNVMTKLGYINFGDILDAEGETLLPLTQLYDLVKEIR